MVSYNDKSLTIVVNEGVLILIVVEDGLVHKAKLPL